MNTPTRKEFAALPKEELLELRRRIVAALPREWQMAMLSGREEDRIPQEEYDKFVLAQFELYKASKEPAAQAVG